MFDFLDSDWFIIGLEIVFLILIIFDIKKYVETKKNEYMVNIVLTLGFAIWTLYPFYNSYFEWDEKTKQEMLKKCDDSNNTQVCNCIDESIFKNYTFLEYSKLDKRSKDYKDEIKEMREDCEDDSWF